MNYQGEGLIEVQLFDVRGSLLKSLTFSAENYLHEMEVSGLKNGIYFVRVFEANNLVGTEKVTIQH